MISGDQVVVIDTVIAGTRLNGAVGAAAVQHAAAVVVEARRTGVSGNWVPWWVCRLNRSSEIMRSDDVISYQ